MNTLLIKQLNDTQQKMGAYLSLLDLRYRNLCVKSEPLALLPVTVDTGDEQLNLEDVANVSKPNDFQLAIYPNTPNFMQDIIRGVFDAHPEFKLDIRDMNEDRKNQEMEKENQKVQETDQEDTTIEEEGSEFQSSEEEEPDMCDLGLDDVFDEDSPETKYLLYTMPEVNKDRHDFLDNGVKLLHQQCMVRLDAEYAAGQKRLNESEKYSSEKDMAEARQDLKDILDDIKDKADQMLQDKEQEIEEAYLHYLKQHGSIPDDDHSDDEQEQGEFDGAHGFRVSQPQTNHE